MSRTFQVAAQLIGISTRADNSIGMRFVTNKEVLDKEELVTLFSYNHQLGWLLFRENAFDDVDIPAGDAQDSHKTPSQRLRGVLYRVFELTGRPKGEFNAWYLNEMERIIDHYKDKLC